MTQTVAWLKKQLENVPKTEESKQEELRGFIKIEIVEAKLDRSTEYFGKQDPFAELSLRMQKYKTKTHTDGAKAPVWNETTTLDVLDLSESIKI